MSNALIAIKIEQLTNNITDDTNKKEIIDALFLSLKNKDFKEKRQYAGIQLEDIDVFIKLASESNGKNYNDQIRDFKSKNGRFSNDLYFYNEEQTYFVYAKTHTEQLQVINISNLKNNVKTYIYENYRESENNDTSYNSYKLAKDIYEFLKKDRIAIYRNILTLIKNGCMTEHPNKPFIINIIETIHSTNDNDLIKSIDIFFSILLEIRDILSSMSGTQNISCQKFRNINFDTIDNLKNLGLKVFSDFLKKIKDDLVTLLTSDVEYTSKIKPLLDLQQKRENIVQITNDDVYEDFNLLVRYVLNFDKLEVPGINRCYIFLRVNENCSEEFKKYYNQHEQTFKELYNAFIQFSIRDDSYQYFKDVKSLQPTIILKNGTEEYIYITNQINVYITTMSTQYNAYSNNLKTYYSTQNEKYLLDIFLNETKNKNESAITTLIMDRIKRLDSTQLHMLYNYLQRIMFLNYLHNNSNIYNFVLGLPYEYKDRTHDLWRIPFINIFQYKDDNRTCFLDPFTKFDSLTKMFKLPNVKEKEMSSGSGAFRVVYEGTYGAEKSLFSPYFIKGYKHKNLFSPDTLKTRFAVARMMGGESGTVFKEGQLCISNTRIYNEIVMNYLMKQITKIDTDIKAYKNNIHTYKHIYTPNEDTVYILQDNIGYKSGLGDDKYCTTLTDIIENYYAIFKRQLKDSPREEIQTDYRPQIAGKFIELLRPYLETLQVLRRNYKFVHTDLHFGNIFIKENKTPPAQQKDYDSNIHGTFLKDLDRCVLLIADYDLARLTIELDKFPNEHIQEIKKMDNKITHVDFKSIFIESKELTGDDLTRNIVPKMKKPIQKKETVIRTRCGYEDYDFYSGYIDDDQDEQTNIDIKKIIYSNWDLLSIFINVISFFKRYELKLYKYKNQAQESVEQDFTRIYEPIIKLFTQYINKVPRLAEGYPSLIQENLFHYCYACLNIV